MFEKRSYDAELMDDLEGGGEDMARTLDELETINRLLGGHKVVTDGLKKLIPANAEKPIRVADLGCGGGDMLRILSRWARKQGLPLELTGIDANAFIVDYAGSRSVGYDNVHYRQMDIFSDAFAAEEYDVVLCSLFCHHFTDEQLIHLFSRLKKQARLGVLINDLHRHWFAYYSIKYLTRMLSSSPLIRNDAPLSVARAFRKPDITRILAGAGITDYSLKWMWAFRYQLIFK